MSEHPVTVEIWADLTCPWCYIAKHRLRAAITAYEHPATVSLHHKAFELDPDLIAGQRYPVAEYLGRKYGGGVDDGRAMTQRVAEVAAADGLELDFERAVKTSTFDAHRLLALADHLGGWELQQAAMERFYAAHFQEGLALDDHAVLLRLAAEAGLDAPLVDAVLGNAEYADSVRRDAAEARELGVTAVPFAVANRRIAVSGAQPVEVYLDLLHQASAEPS